MKLFAVAILLPAIALMTVVLWFDLDPPVTDSDVPSDEVRIFAAADSSGNGHDGIIQGRVTRGLPGRRGTSYSFSQVGSWVQVASSQELNPEANDFLVSVWISLPDGGPGPDETYDVIRKGLAYTVSGEFKLEVMPQGLVRCTATDRSSRLAQVTSVEAVVTDGRWQRIGCARTGQVWSALVGDSVTSLTVDLGAVGNTMALSIGSKYGLEDRPVGRVDGVRLVIDRGSATDADRYPPDVPSVITGLRRQPPTARWRFDEATTRVAGR